MERNELKNIAYPAVFEKDKNDDRLYNVFFPDLNLKTHGFGFEDATLKARFELGLFIKNANICNLKKPSSREELIKIYPHKRMYNVCPVFDEYEKKLTSPSTHYLVLKIVKSTETNFNASEVSEVTEPFDKIILFLTLLNHCDIEDGFSSPKQSLFLNQKQSDEQCAQCAKANECYNSQKEDLRNLLYSLKEPLVEEYAKQINSNKVAELEFINKIINNQTAFSCCTMFNMGHTKDMEDCMCGFYSYKTIKKQLDELNCFNNVQEFVKKFLSPEYKFVALKLEYGEDDNIWDYINE